MSNKMIGAQKIFYDHAKKKIHGLEYEVWIGRYRVDFYLRSKKIAIEIDGHEFHSTKEQRTNDAVRERYLQRLGLTVIRFTGNEVTTNVTKCIEEVVQFIKSTEVDKLHNKSIFVDLLFLSRETLKTTRYYQNEYPEKNLKMPPLSSLLREICGCLRLNGDYNVFIVGVWDFFSNSLFDFDVIKYLEYSGGELIVFEELTDFLVTTIFDLMEQCKGKHDELILVGDDLGYVPILRDKDLITKLMRKNNDETSMVGITVSWQDIDYAIAAALGLERHEW